MKHKTWDDNVLFYGGEALILLVAEGYIVYHTYEGVSSIPFCVGLLITALVAAVGMHWALTKLSKKLIGGGYFVWLAITVLVCFTAGVLWMASDRRKDHEKSLAEVAAGQKQKADIDMAADTKKSEAKIAGDLTTLQGLQPLLAQAKTPAEKKRIIDLARSMVAQPTPTVDIAAAVALAVAPKPVAVNIEWRAFDRDTFFDFWYHNMTRFCSLLGIIGLAILLGVHILYTNEETALRHAQATAQTTTTVTTSGPIHTPAPAPRQIGYAEPATARNPPQLPPTNTNTTFSSGGLPPNSTPRQ